MKSFKTITQQIELLKKRGLIFTDIEHAQKYLLSNNYYNIINGYGKFFQDSPDKFKIGTTFDEVSQLYFCDKQLKQAFFNSILNVEHHLKSIFAYRFAQYYSNKRYAYLDINSYNENKVLEVGKLISSLSYLINFHKTKSGDPIAHYVKKYNDVPIWIIVEFLDFGQLCAMIKNSKRQLQNKICKDCIDFLKDNNINLEKVHFTPEIFISFIDNIRELRNVCAHNNRLMDFKCKADSKYFGPLHSLYNIEPSKSRRQPFSIYVEMQCFLSSTEFNILNNTLRKKINFLNNHLSSIEIEKILGSLNFPPDWLEKPKIIQ